MKLKVLMYVLIFFIPLIGCKKKDIKPDLPDISVVDISQESDWDYWIVGKKDYYYIKAENNLPKSVVFHSSEADKDYSIFFSEDGMPDKVAVDNHIFLLSNFNGDKVDVGIVYPNGEIEILRDLETNYDFSNLSLKSAKSTEDWSDVIRWTGRAVGAVPCILSIVAATNSAGVLTPLALWSCGNYVLKLASSVATNEGDIHNGFTEFMETYNDVSLITACSSGTDLTACAFGSASRAFSEWADYQEQIEDSRAEDVQTVEAALIYGSGDVQITLVWDNEADLDLHVYDPNNEEIWWKYRFSYSGGILDVDDIDGFGPENVYWPKGEAPVGNYQVYLHYYDWEEPWRPATSNYTILINAFGRFKKYTGSIAIDETILIQDFDQTGLKSANIGRSLTISKLKKSK